MEAATASVHVRVEACHCCRRLAAAPTSPLPGRLPWAPAQGLRLTSAQ